MVNFCQIRTISVTEQFRTKTTPPRPPPRIFETDEQLIETKTMETEAPTIDHATIIKTWEESLKDMKSKIRKEREKALEATTKADALEEQYWHLEGRLDVAKEYIRQQSLSTQPTK